MEILSQAKRNAPIKAKASPEDICDLISAKLTVSLSVIENTRNHYYLFGSLLTGPKVAVLSFDKTKLLDVLDPQKGLPRGVCHPNIDQYDKAQRLFLSFLYKKSNITSFICTVQVVSEQGLVEFEYSVSEPLVLEGDKSFSKLLSLLQKQLQRIIGHVDGFFHNKKDIKVSYRFLLQPKDCSLPPTIYRIPHKGLKKYCNRRVRT